MQLWRFCVGSSEDYTCAVCTVWRTSHAIVKVLCWFRSKLCTSRNTVWRTAHAILKVLFWFESSYTRPGRTIWRTSNAIVKVLCWFESKLYMSRTYNWDGLPCHCKGFVLVWIQVLHVQDIQSGGLPMQLWRFCVGLNPSYTRPGRTIWRTSQAIAKVLCWFGYRFYTSRTCNLEDFPCICERFVLVCHPCNCEGIVLVRSQFVHVHDIQSGRLPM